MGELGFFVLFLLVVLGAVFPISQCEIRKKELQLECLKEKISEERCKELR